MVISMGFATNSTTLPALVDKGSLFISEKLNHSLGLPYWDWMKGWEGMP